MATMAPNVLDTLVDALAERMAQKGRGVAFKHTNPTGTPSTPYYTGPGGLFGVEGLERDLFSTRIQPRSFADMIPVFTSPVMNPYYAFLTGFQAGSGSEPSGVCDNPPTAGAGKSCVISAQFGRYSRMTRELEINRVGQQISRGEFTDLMFVNDPLTASEGLNVITPATAPDSLTGALLRREVLMRFIELGVEFQNLLARQIWTGDPANNTAGGGYQEFPGLNELINTGYRDAFTGTTCPALDADIKNFQYGLVNPASGSSGIVNVLTYLARYLRHNAERMNLMPATWVVVMRETLFYEITNEWPCSYLTYRCNLTDQNRLVVDPGDAIRMRDDMRENKYLLIDGVRWPVMIDDGITELDEGDNNQVPAAGFASDIYFIPLTVRGGRPVTYWEFYDYRNAPLDAINDGRLNSYYWTDGGRFLWHAKPPLNWCVQWVAKAEPRIVLRTPQLSGRLQNVAYRPLQHERSPFPTDNYFVDGGVTGARTTPSLYAVWK